VESIAGVTEDEPVGTQKFLATICELVRLLGYNGAKAKMLVGQGRLDLVGPERKPQDELDEGPQIHVLRTAAGAPGTTMA